MIDYSEALSWLQWWWALPAWVHAVVAVASVYILPTGGWATARDSVRLAFWAWKKGAEGVVWMRKPSRLQAHLERVERELTRLRAELGDPGMEGGVPLPPGLRENHAMGGVLTGSTRVPGVSSPGY